MTTAQTWQAADKSYQLHHVNCPTCAAAGRKPGEHTYDAERKQWLSKLSDYLEILIA